MKTQPTAATAQSEPTEAMTELEAYVRDNSGTKLISYAKEQSGSELISEASAEANALILDNQKAKHLAGIKQLALARVRIDYKIDKDELEVINKFANRETMLYLLLRVHMLNQELPRVWKIDEIKSFCDKYCDEYGEPFIKWHQFVDLIRKLEKKGILETDRQLSFEWAQ